MGRSPCGRRQSGRGRAGLLLTLLLLTIGPATAQEDDLPGILGADDRVPRDSVDWPWAAIGRVNRATGGYCTGTLVGPRHVLTAAHCLFDRGRRRLLPEDIHFVAGYRRGDYLAHSVARDVIMPETYRPEDALRPGMLAQDWAIIILQDVIPIRPIPVRDPGSAGMQGMRLLRAGYSQDRAHLLSVHDGCALAEPVADGTLLLHDCDATRGDSGSPLLYRREGDLTLVGVDVGVGRFGGADRGLAVPTAGFETALQAALADP